MKLFNIFNWVQNLIEAFTFYSGGGSGGGGSTTSTSYSTNLPEYAQPFYEELLKQAGKQSFTTDTSGNVTGIKPYVPFTGERVAGFTPEQLAIQQQVAGLQTPGQFAQAGAGLGALQATGLGASQAGLNRALGYNPSFISSQNIGAPSLQNFGMNAAQTNYNPNISSFQTGNVREVNAPYLQQYGMDAAQLAYNPNLTTYQMGPARNVASRNIGTQNFGQGAADYYMSPYAQAAINPALREARLQGDLQKQAGMLGSIGRGTFGGARQALLQAEQERGTQRTMGDIQATGMEKAYQNAQAQFQADQVRQLQAQQANQQYGLQAQLANQQAGLTTGQQNLQAALGVQQLGTQSGLQAQLANLSNAQQASVQNLAAQLQTQGLSAEQAIKAALANQQTQQQTALANQQAALNAQQLGVQTGTQLSLANLTNAQQANVQNLAAQLQTQGLSADQAMKAALANQQSNLQAQQLTQQGQQYAAGLGKDVGLAGLSTALEGSKALGALGATQQQTNLERLKAQAATAEEKQALQQQINDLEYQKFQEQQNYQRSLLEYYSNILRGNAGALGSSQVAYTPAPSMASQIGGLGLAGLGLANVLGRG
jgi:hypothetical protein